MRFIATADWQLGMAAHYLDDEARPRFHQARFDAVRQIARVAGEEGARFVVVAGDVFESNQLNRSVISRAVEALREFTVPVVLLPGNHDPLDAASIYDDPAFTSRVPEHVHVIREPGAYLLMDGVEIVGAPWFSKRPLADLVAEACRDLTPAPPGTTRVVLGHGAVSTLPYGREDPAMIDVDALSRVLSEGRAHVAILGDRHATHEIAPNIWYPGAPEVTDRREDDPGNVLIIDAGDPGVSVTKRRVGTWEFRVLTRHVSDEDIEQLAAELDHVDDKERTALWLALTGTISTRTRARLEQVLDEQRDVFARLEFWRRHTDLATVATDADFSDLGLSGFAREALDELSAIAGGSAESSGPGEGPETAQDALALLYRLAGGTGGEGAAA